MWAAVWTIFVFCIRSYQRSSELARPSARGPGQRIVSQDTLHCDLESQLPALGLSLPVVSKTCYSPVPPGLLLLFLKQLRTWVGFFLRETQICQYWSGLYQWQAEGRAWHPSSIAHSGVSFGRSGGSASHELPNWETPWWHSVVSLVTKDERPYVCLSFVTPTPKQPHSESKRMVGLVFGPNH